jgi:monothiol glutaredoxin
MTDQKILDFIQNEIDNNDVVMFIKGTADFPQCGFSAIVVRLMRKLHVKFRDINVLEHLGLREGIKKFTDWPTIPQIYVKGEFIGGCDILREMYDNGELVKVLKEKNVEYNEVRD